MADELFNLVVARNAEEGKLGSDAWFWGEVGPDDDDTILSLPDLLRKWLGSEGAQKELSDEQEEAQDGQEALLTDLRAWRLKSKRKGKVAPFKSEAIPEAMQEAVKTLGEDDWRRGFTWVARMQAYKAKREPDRLAELALRDEIVDKLEMWRAEIARQVFNSDDVNYDAVSKELNALLVRYLTGASIDEFMAQSVLMGISFDIARVNIAALEWASAYSYELVKDIEETTRRLVSASVSQFVLTPGMTIGDIEALLEKSFGPVRAEMIAVTETTRAYSQGTMILQQMLKNAGLPMIRLWRTGMDDVVCVRCKPLEDKPESEWPSEFKPAGPPAHVNCRCGTVLSLPQQGKSVAWPWLGDEVKGGAGSGNFGHAGRPGVRGGSAGGGGGLAPSSVTVGVDSQGVPTANIATTPYKGAMTDASKIDFVIRERADQQTRMPFSVAETGMLISYQKCLEGHPAWATTGVESIEFQPGEGFGFEAGGSQYKASACYDEANNRITVFKQLFKIDAEVMISNGTIDHEIGHGILAKLHKVRTWKDGKMLTPSVVGRRRNEAKEANVNFSRAFAKHGDGITEYSKAWQNHTETIAEAYQIYHAGAKATADRFYSPERGAANLRAHLERGGQAELAQPILDIFKVCEKRGY